MYKKAKVALSSLLVAAAVLCLPLAGNAQPAVYSDVVPTPTECDAANPGGAFAAWVIIPGSKLAQLELQSTLKDASAAVFFTHLTQYANGDPKVLPADSFQFTLSQPSSTGEVFPVVEWKNSPGGVTHVKKLKPTSVVTGNKGQRVVVTYDMHAAPNNLPAKAQLVGLYLLTFRHNGGPFFGYFNDFFIDGNQIYNKNFTTYPCLGDIAVQVAKFAP